MQSSSASHRSSPLVQIFSSAPCSQTPSIYVVPLVWEIKFHTHKKQQVQLFEVYMSAEIKVPNTLVR
jgi:hypothetical protein